MKEVHMPVKSLPSNPSLDHLKYQARDLLNALTQGNAEAVARAREFHHRFARLSDDEIRASKFSLADALLIIAREYGFQSWPKLKQHVEASAKGVASTLAEFKPPTGPVELKMKWPAGARIVREMDLKQNMEIYTPGKPEPAKHELSMTTQYAYTVGKELPDRRREVDLQHFSFRLEFNSGAYLWRYDSAWKYAADQPPIAVPLKMVMDAKVRYFLDANNQVERMEGVDELVKRLNVRQGAKLKPGMTWDNRALDDVINRITSGARKPLVADTGWLRNMFSEEYFKKKLDPSFLPAKAVQPGDTWNLSSEWLMHGGGLFRIGIVRDYVVTFERWEMRGERICARLGFRGTEKTSPRLQSKTTKLAIPVTAGTSSGVVWFDPELGRGIEAVSNRDFTVTSNKIAAAPYANPVVGGRIQAVTDHHHQVITEKLVSVQKPDGSS
jgi:hypothetical protein